MPYRLLGVTVRVISAIVPQDVVESAITTARPVEPINFKLSDFLLAMVFHYSYSRYFVLIFTQTAD
jgi:hypothetical protein